MMSYHGRIHSRTEDNWDRVVSIFTTVKDLYKVTEHSEYRKLKISGVPLPSVTSDDFFPNVQVRCLDMPKESIMVEMLMVWVAITIESAINHIVAEQKIDEDSIKDILNKVKNKKTCPEIKKDFTLTPEKLKDCGLSEENLPETAIKIMIINTFQNETVLSEDELIEIIQIINTIAQIRNAIVHDKPIGERTIYDEDGEFLDVAIDDFSKHKSPLNSSPIYEDLNDFFVNCDNVVKFITKNTNSDFHFLKFQSLLN